MGSTATATAAATAEQPHAVCIPFPAQGHINPMMMLAKILHHKGFHITFVNTEYNQRRFIKSRGTAAVAGIPGFRFATIPDGLPPSDADATQDIPSLCISTNKTCLEPFCELLTEINRNSATTGVPPVSCIVSDGIMIFTLQAAERFGLPEVMLWTTSACGLLGYAQYHRLVNEGFTPLKDPIQLSNGYLDTMVDGVPGVAGLRLRDFPSFIRTTDLNDPNGIMVNFVFRVMAAFPRAQALIFNTFDELEQPVLDALASFLPPIYTVGPLHHIINQLPAGKYESMDSSLWKKDNECIKWLDGNLPGSVVYVNFGSITVVTAAQLTEFAWGLANSKRNFLWVIRPDIVAGDTAMVPEEFFEETKGRSMITSWCPQEEVLQHTAVGGFLTHSGWNSTLESISSGVPMVCWPFFAEQQTNCRFSCVEWGIGMEIDNAVNRDEVEVLVREMMEGEKGQRMKEKAAVWREKAMAAALPVGSSYTNLDRLVQEVLGK